MPRAIELDEDDDELFDSGDERPLPRARRRLPWFRMSLFSGLCIAGLAYLAEHEAALKVPNQPGAVPATVLIAPPPTWQILNSTAAYGLDKTLGSAIAEARQHSGGGREDTLVVGAPGTSRYARVTMSHRIPVAPRTFYVDLVRRAAEAGLAVERSGQTAMIATKFGPVESAPVTLAGPAEQACEAFRFRDDDAAFGFQGWLCEPGISAQRVACFLDAMTALGTDPSISAFFAGAERSRVDHCAPEARNVAAGSKPVKALPGPSASALR